MGLYVLEYGDRVLGSKRWIGSQKPAVKRVRSGYTSAATVNKKTLRSFQNILRSPIKKITAINDHRDLCGRGHYRHGDRHRGGRLLSNGYGNVHRVIHGLSAGHDGPGILHILP